MLYFSTDFGDLTIDGLIDTGALSSAISGSEIDQIKQIEPQKILRRPPPKSQILVANGQTETPIASREFQFKVGTITFAERFIVIANLANPLIELLILQRYGNVLDMRQGIRNFPSFSMQLMDANNPYQNITEPLLNPHEFIRQPEK